MSTKSFATLMARLESSAEGQAERVSVNFLAQVNTRMQALGLSNAELAQRMGTSPAYITRLFRGSANLSVQTMVKLAQALGNTLRVELAEPVGVGAPTQAVDVRRLPSEIRQPTPETVAAMTEARGMTAARYGSANALFDALDKKSATAKRSSAKKV